MKAIPVVITAIVVALLAFVSPAVFSPTDGDWGVGFNPLFVPSYGIVIFAVVGVTAAAFRGIWLSTRRDELGSRLALGATRRSIVASHVRDGVRDGLVAGACGVALGGGVRQVQAGTTSLQFEPTALWNYLGLLIFAVACLMLAYGLIAARFTRGSVKAVSDGHGDTRADAGTRRPHPRRLGRWLAWIAVTLAAAAVVTLVLVPAVFGASATRSGPLPAVVMVLLLVGFYVALPALLVWAGTRIAMTLVRVARGWLDAGAGPGSTRSLAADGLARPTPMRGAALAGVVAVMGVCVTVAVVAGSSDARYELSTTLTPHATVSTVALDAYSDPLDTLASGWAPALPEQVLTELRDDPALIVIEAGVLVTDVRDVSGEHPWGESYDHQDRDVLVAADAASLTAVAPHGGRPLYYEGSVEWQHGNVGLPGVLATGEPVLSVNGVRAEVTPLQLSTPWAGVERAWAEEQWGSAPPAALLVFPSGEDSVETALARHELGDAHVFILGAPYLWVEPSTASLLVLVTAPFLLVAVGIVVALAWASQRTRVADHATMVALGATARSMRAAAFLEAAVPTAVGAVVGVAGGAVAGWAFASVGGVPWGAASTATMLWNAGFTVAQAPWLAIAVLVVLAVVAAGLGAALARARVDGRSPVEQLAEARKAGAL